MNIAKFIKKFLADKRGLTGPVLALVIGLVVIAILLPVGLIIVGNLNTTISAMDLGATGNATRTTLFSNIYSAFNLAVIVPIIAAAGIIISVVGAYFAFRTPR